MNWGLLLHHIVPDGSLNHHLHLTLRPLSHHHLSWLMSHHLLLLWSHLPDNLTSLYLHLLLIRRPHGHTKTLTCRPHKSVLHLHLLTRSWHWGSHPWLR